MPEDAHYNRIIHGDALEELKKLPDHSIDAVISDPPAGIAFMGKDWDNFQNKNISQRPSPFMQELRERGGGNNPTYLRGRGQTVKDSLKARDAFIEFLTEIMREALRVIKPGGHALIWALPRTSHWTAYALENAGWEVREKLYHVFGSGYPKSHNISKAIDKHLHAEREVIGTQHVKDIRRNVKKDRELGITHDQGKWAAGAPTTYIEHPITAPATPQAKQWDGWGSATKPAAEEWILCRAPLSEKSIAENVLRWGVGGINVDGTRIEHNETWACNGSIPQISPRNGDYIVDERYGEKVLQQSHPKGRWPANFILSHSLFCSEGACVEDCPVALLDRQSGTRKSGAKSTMSTLGYGRNENHIIAQSTPYEANSGGASRYFQRFHPGEEDLTPFYYASKASKRERNTGCEELPAREAGVGETHPSGDFTQRLHPERGDIPPVTHQNHHPTVKSQALMRYLARLVTPPGGTVLDMFGGSGSTALACIVEGFNYILVEQEESYVNIARARVAHANKIKTGYPYAVE